MTSIKVKFRPSSSSNNIGSIYYQITHDRTTRQLLTKYRIYPYEWNSRLSLVITTRRSERKSYIHAIRDQMRWDLERLTKIVHKMQATRLEFTADEVITEFLNYSKEYSLFNFMEKAIIKLKRKGKIRTSETYKATLNSFKKFRNDEDIMLDSINSDLMESFEAWHLQRGLTYNTISFYMRILRAVYNRAVDEDIIESRNPFRHVYTGVEKTVKRALPLNVIKKIKTLDLSNNPSLDYARDMFILSFMLRGMSFIDMMYLRKKDRINGYIIYRRRKTGQRLVIKWTEDMQMILNKYPENKTEYLLPIIKDIKPNDRHIYRNTSYNINHSLKVIAKIIGIHCPLTLYVARHSWASAAQSKGIPLRVICEGMGHDSETTTQIYLANLDTTAVDKANSIILKCLY